MHLQVCTHGAEKEAGCVNTWRRGQMCACRSVFVLKDKGRLGWAHGHVWLGSSVCAQEGEEGAYECAGAQRWLGVCTCSMESPVYLVLFYPCLALNLHTRAQVLRRFHVSSLQKVALGGNQAASLLLMCVTGGL